MSKLQDLQRELASLTQKIATVRNEQQQTITAGSDSLSKYNSELSRLKREYDDDLRRNGDSKRKIESEIANLERQVKEIEGKITAEETHEREESDRKHAQEAKDRAAKAK